MKNSKIRILMVPSDHFGVGHFRNIWPAKCIDAMHRDEIYVEINPKPNINDENYLKKFDIIHFHRMLGPYEQSEKNFQRIRELGVKLVLDIDDYWEPSPNHPLYPLVMQNKLPEKIVKNLSLADYVTTTTTIFEEYIKEHNPNTYVIPNAIDTNDKMWKSEGESSDRCRITWVGGSSHEHDLKKLKDSFVKLYTNKELEDKFQVILCGFDTRGHVTEQLPNGQNKTRKIKPSESIWKRFESIFTDNYRGLSDDQDYINWLNKIKREEYPEMNDKRYVRRWTLPLTKYGYHYDFCDVCLAPLAEIETYNSGKGIRKRKNIFNEVKSELKIIEAGMKKKVLIAQDFGIYKELMEDGVTGLLVKEDKDWYKAMRRVITDKELRETMANNLHNFVKDRYSLEAVTQVRVDFYKSIMD